MKKLLILICLMVLFVGCSSKAEKPETSKIEVSDSALIMEKYDQDKQISSFSIKDIGSDLCEVASDVDSSDYDDPISQFGHYYISDGSFVYLDSNNNLQRVFKNNTKENISSNIATQEDNIYDESLGYLESFYNDSFRYANYYNTKKTYAVSPNGRTIGYIDSKLNLHIQSSFDEQKSDLTIASDVTNFTMNISGEYIYYLEQGHRLCFYSKNDENKQTIANNVNLFFISPNGKYVVWKDIENKIYTKNINSQDKEKEVFTLESSSDDIPFKIYDNGSILYLNSYVDKVGDLTIYLNGESQNVAFDISLFTEIKDKIYYINNQNALCEKSINNLDSAEKIITNSISVVSIIPLSKDIYILDNLDNLYKINKNSRLDKISSNVSNFELGYYQDSNTLDNNMVFLKNKNNDNLAELYINNDSNDNKIANDVRAFRCNSKYVAYIDSNYKVHLYDIETKKDTIEIENARQYSNIHFGNQIWCTITLKSITIEGDWKNYDNHPFTIDNKSVNLIRFNDNSTATFYFDDGTEFTDSYQEMNDVRLSYYMRISFSNLTHDDNPSYDINWNKYYDTIMLSDGTNSFYYRATFQ